MEPKVSNLHGACHLYYHSIIYYRPVKGIILRKGQKKIITRKLLTDIDLGMILAAGLGIKKPPCPMKQYQDRSYRRFILLDGEDFFFYLQLFRA